MKGLSEEELERLVNEYALEVDGITEEQAENSEVGGDSDADDDVPLASLRSSFDSSSSTPRSGTPRSVTSTPRSGTSTPLSCTYRSGTPQPSTSTPRSSISSPQPSTSASRSSMTTLQPSTSTQGHSFSRTNKRKNAPESASSSDSEEENRRLAEEKFQRPKEQHEILLPDNSNNAEEESEEDEMEVNEEDDAFDWKAEGNDPSAFAESDFNQPFGPKTPPENFRSPVAYFSLFFSEIFLSLIIDQSQLYAAQQKKTFTLDRPELRAFLGIVIYMGFHSLPSMRLYWSTDENFHCERIARIMPVKRFLKILRLLHLADNSEMPTRKDPKYDKLYKVRPLLDIMTTAFPKYFSPSRYIAIDESMVAFKGRSSMKQYMPLKPIKRGFKVWVMCCAVTGYMLAFDVYIGKDQGRPADMNLGEYVVCKLSAILQGLYYCLFFDNFFTSILLMKRLLSKRLFGCGTMRQNRKLFPSRLTKARLKLGEHTSVQSGDYSVSLWKDRGKKPVCVASNMHNSSNTEVIKRTSKSGEKEDIGCPKSIADYNRYMGGVDRMDQLLSAYSVAQKSRRWWIKIFYYFVDCAIVNGYIIYKETMKSKKEKPASQLTFRSILANELIGDYCSKKRKGFRPYKGFARKKYDKNRATKVENTLRLSDVGSHIPKKIAKRRRCAYCSSKANEKRSDLLCEKCNVALCKGCFASFHKK